MSLSAKFRTVLVGAGYVSAHHLKALRALPSVEIAGIVDTDLGRAQKAALRFGVPCSFKTLAEAAAVSPDVVHILTLPESHASLAIDALQMGCHVLVEKPMAETVKDCDRMIAAADAAGRILAVNHSARMDPIVLKAQQIISKGACGEVISVDFFRSSDYPPYSGGPILPAFLRKGSYPLQDLGVHALSIFESFLGSVQDTEIFYRSSGVDPNLLLDEWRGLAHCERGVGQMYLSWNVRPIRSEAILHGTRGIMRLDFFLQTISVVPKLPGPKFAGNVAGTLASSVKSVWQVPINVARFAVGRLPGAPGIHVSIRKFYESIEQGLPVPVPASEGRRIVASIERACSSADSEKEKHRDQQLRPLSPRSTLVTGAGGFLGKALVNRLVARGEMVRAQVRRRVPEFETNPLIQVVCGDLGDPEFMDHAIAGVQEVFHVGATMRGGAADFERGTIWGTRNVIQSCLRHGVKKLIYVSSLSVLDHAGHDCSEPVRESSPYEPHAERRGLYTQKKLEAERMVLEAVGRDGLTAVILRPGQIFGPGAQTQAPTGSIGLGDRWIFVGDGRRVLPLVYVEDIVDSLLLAREPSIANGSIFNIVDTNPTTQREYVAACRQTFGNRFRAVYVPEFIMYSLGWACECVMKLVGHQLPLSRYRIKSIRPLSRFDMTNTQQTLGWRPVVGAKRGLELTFGSRVRVSDENAEVGAI